MKNLPFFPLFVSLLSERSFISIPCINFRLESSPKLLDLGICHINDMPATHLRAMLDTVESRKQKMLQDIFATLNGGTWTLLAP